MELSFTLQRLGSDNSPLISKIDNGEGTELISLDTGFQYSETFSVGFPQTSYPFYKQKETLQIKINGINVVSDYKIDSKKNIHALPLASLNISNDILKEKYNQSIYLNIESFNIELQDRVLKVFGWEYSGVQKQDSEIIKLEYSRISGNRVTFEGKEIFRSVYVIRYRIPIDPPINLLGEVNSKPLMKAEFIKIDFFTENEYKDFLNIVSGSEPTCYFLNKDKNQVIIDRNKKFFVAGASELSFINDDMESFTVSGESERVFIIGEQYENGKFVFKINDNYINIIGDPFPISELYPRINSIFQRPDSDIFKFWLSKFLMAENNIVQNGKTIAYSQGISITIEPPVVGYDTIENVYFMYNEPTTIKGISLLVNSSNVFMGEVKIQDLNIEIPTELTDNQYLTGEYVGENIFPSEQLIKLGTYGLTKFRFSRVIFLLNEPIEYLEDNLKKFIIKFRPCFYAKMDTEFMVNNNGSGLYDNYWRSLEFPLYKDGEKWVLHTPELEESKNFSIIEKTNNLYIKKINRVEYPFLSLENYNNRLIFNASIFDEIVFKGKYIKMGKVWETFPNFMEALKYYAPTDYIELVLYSKADGKRIDILKTSILSFTSISPQVIASQTGNAVGIIEGLPNNEVIIEGLKYSLGQRIIEFPQIKVNPLYSFYSAMNGILAPDGNYFEAIDVAIYDKDGYIENFICSVFYDTHSLSIPEYDPSVNNYMGGYKRLIICAKSTNVAEIMGGNAALIYVEKINGDYIGVEIFAQDMSRIQNGELPFLNKLTDGYKVILGSDKNFIPLFLGNYVGSLLMVTGDDSRIYYFDLKEDYSKDFLLVPPDPPTNLQIPELTEVLVGNDFQINPTVTGRFIEWQVENPNLIDGITIDSKTGIINGNLNPNSFNMMTDVPLKVYVKNPIGEIFKDIILRVYVPLVNINYSQMSYSFRLNINTTIAPVFSGTGDTPTLWTVTPALPSGMNINPTTGAISGTPSIVSGDTSYTVRASKGIVFREILLSIQVVMQIKDISYPQASYSFFTGTSVPSIIPNLSGEGENPTLWTVAPALPSGMNINPTTGVISGNPTAGSVTIAYTVTASRDNVSKSFVISIEVRTQTAITSISYNSGSAIPLINTTVSYTPVVVGGVPTSYSISPALPAGLSINPTTGVISGTTPSTSSDVTYTITATNSLGSRTGTFRLRIVYVNTTMRVNHVNFAGMTPSDSFRGFSKGGAYNGGRVFGMLDSDLFRGQRIHALDFYVINNFIHEALFAVTGSFPNTDAGFFRQITFNGRVMPRSNSNYSNGFTPGFTHVSQYPSNVTYSGVADGQTTQVIIE